MKHRLGALAVVTLAFWLRIRDLRADVVHDEAWYFYLARLHPAQVEPPNLELANLWARPVLYVFFAPWAQLGFWQFRLANVLVGCALVVLLMALARAFRLEGPVVYALGLTAAINPLLVTWSGKVLPDMLGTTLALAAVLAALRHRCLLAAVLASASSLVKEPYLVVPAILLVLFGTDRRKRLYFLSAALPGCLAWLVAYRLGLPLQGWCTAEIEADFAGLMGFNLATCAGLVVLAVHREGRLLVLSLAFPAFYVAWHLASGRGVFDWYAVPAIPWLLLGYGRACHLLTRSSALAAVLCCALWLTPPYRERLGRLPEGPGDLSQAVALVATHPSGRLVVLGANWSFACYPFSDVAVSVLRAEGDLAPETLARADAVVAYLPGVNRLPAGLREWERRPAGRYQVFFPPSGKHRPPCEN